MIYVIWSDFISSDVLPEQKNMIYNKVIKEDMKIAQLFAVLLLSVAVLSCPDNCADCDPSGNLCFVCSEGFELSVMGKCVDQNMVPNCVLYGPIDTLCFACKATYILEG